MNASSKGDLLEAYFLDLIGLIVLNKVEQTVKEIAEKQGRNLGWGVSPFLSPGSIHGWELEEQLKLCTLLPLKSINVKIRGDAVLSPFKTIPCLIGLGPGYDSVQVGTTCQVCSKNDDTLKNKIEVIKKGLTLHKPDPEDPIDVLSKIGGLEIGGIAGLVLGAAAKGIPVICDGFISTAGALIACELAPAAKNYLFASHKSVEIGHIYMYERLGLNPLIDLKFRLGEGTGAAVCMELLDLSTRILADIKTFEEVGIENAQ